MADPTPEVYDPRTVTEEPAEGAPGFDEYPEWLQDEIRERERDEDEWCDRLEILDRDRRNHLIAAGGTIGAAVFFMIGAPVTGIVVQAFVAGLAAAVIARRSLGGPGGAITFGGLTMVTSWFFAGSIPFLSLFSSWVCFAACGALLGVMSESRRTTDHLV